MITFEIYRSVQEYLESSITLHELEERLLPFMPAILREPYSDDADIVAAVELAKVDFDNGLLDKEEARELIANTFSKYATLVVTNLNADFEITSGTTSVTGSELELDATIRIIKMDPVQL